MRMSEAKQYEFNFLFLNKSNKLSQILKVKFG